MSQPEIEQDEQDDNKAEVLADLDLTAEQAAGTKAGGHGGGGGQGKVQLQDVSFVAKLV